MVPMEQKEHMPTEILVAALRAAGCVYAEDEAVILQEAAGAPGQLEAMLARRMAGHPLEHIVGWAQFHGMRITVASGVFVPRLRTEFLVRQALTVLQSAGATGVVLDLCCGSGAVGAALAAERGGLDVHAADIDPAAVSCARENLAALGGQAHCGDLFEALPEELKGTFQVITANAPYVPTGEIAFMPPEARLFEPDAALNGGADGLDIQRRIAADAPVWLRPGGSLLVETSVRQAPASAAAMTARGFSATIFHSDELDGTVVVGKWGVPAG
jgi:release factor glutamine methyltransferase